VLARLERAMVELKTRWAKGEKAEGVYQAAIAEMQSDALAWFEKHGMTTVRQRLQDAIFAAQQSAQNQIDVLHKQQAFFRIIYEARFTSAVSMLQEHIDAGTASKLDYLRLEGVLRAFDTLMQTFWPYECTG
jgi:hypothetical protein